MLYFRTPHNHRQPCSVVAIRLSAEPGATVSDTTNLQPGRGLGPWGTVALAVAFSALCVGILVTLGPARRTRSPEEPATPVSASELRTQALLRRNETLKSDPVLADAYQSINANYFGGALPAVRIRWEPRLGDIGPLIAEDFRLEGVTNGRVILMNPTLEDDEPQLRRVLCHEAVHVALADRSDGHGPKFQTLLRRLSTEGAFEGLVATDREKSELRAALDRRSEELDREMSRLRGSWAEVDAADAVRVEEYNARVRRLQASGAEFNRLVAQYNLMISYPDGLDEERLAHRAALPSMR